MRGSGSTLPSPRGCEQREAGGIYFWKGGSLPAGESTAASATWATAGARGGGRLGASVAIIGGGGRANGTTCFLAGSPRATVRSPFVMEGNGVVDVLCTS